MTAHLTVRDVRDALALHSSQGTGGPSTVQLGRIFHEVFAGLIGDDPEFNLRNALLSAGAGVAERRRALARHAYDRLVGPRLVRERASLAGSGDAVVRFWTAVEALCEWLAGLPEIADHVRSEVPVSRTLNAPDWRSPVLLTGVADAILQVAPGRWCVVELKLGRASPEADLAQSLLYHLALSGPSGPEGSVALVSFGPERSERVFRADQVGPARQPLMDLIGRLAGVREGEGPPPVAPPPARSDGAHEALGARLVAALGEYGVEVRLDGPPVVGPTFVRFAIGLGKGVKVGSVENRADELRVRLGLTAGPRIGIEGARVVVDVQRADRQAVPFDSIREDFLGQLRARGAGSLLPVGVGLDGSLSVADLSRPEHAHVLVAGTTGSGKSEWLRTALAGLMTANTPESLRLVVIDPKRNAFTWLKGSPFLLRPVVTPPDESAADVFAELVDEMEARYRAFEQSGADTIEHYASKAGVVLPRIVCACDEYADLVRADKVQRTLIEERINRLGAKARAAGIHLILATQQPSRSLLGGALDANMPARVALRMEKRIESRMILGEAGAETLLGRGDLLFKDIGPPSRLQAPLLSESERDAIARPAADALSR